MNARKPRGRARLALAFALVMAIMAVGGLAGCSDSGETRETPTSAQVGERIGQAVDLGGMRQGDADKLRKLYRVETGEVADFVLYTASSNVKADELAVIQVKEGGDAEAVMAQIRQRLEAQTIKFRDYRPEEYHLIEKHVLKAKGAFVFFAVSADAERMELAFDQALTP